MAKLSKAQIKDHNIAVELLQKDKLSFDEKLIVFEKWNESAVSLNSEAGAFFTPHDLARDFSLNIYDSATTIDLCAGIGMLSFVAYHYRDCIDITCVELNPIYIEVGKKLLPEANWINTSIFDYKEFGHILISVFPTPHSAKSKLESINRFKMNLNTRVPNLI